MRKLMLVMLMAAVMTTTASAEYITAPHGLRVRERPTTASRTVEILPYGAEIAITDDEPIKGWVKIENGYLSREWVSADDPKGGMNYLGNWSVTAYAWTGYPCANGNYPQTGVTVACNSLPFGTQIYIDGIGIRTVEDRGPSSMGDSWCDLYLGDTASCVQWGVQNRDVWIVEEEK